VQVDAWLDDAPYPRALLRTLPSTGVVAEEALDGAAGVLRRVGALLAELGTGPWRAPALEPETRPEDRLWRLCEAAPLEELDRQRLLELNTLDERARVLTALAEEVCGDLRALLAERTS
jgi:Lon protease-like protein